MNRKLVTLSGILGLALGASMLSGCHQTREVDPNGAANAEVFAKEKVLVQKIKANPKDYSTLMELAELRAATGRERVARYNYRQILAADSSSDPELEGLKAQAEVLLAVLRETYKGDEAIADTGFQFNLKTADDVLKGEQK